MSGRKKLEWTEFPIQNLSGFFFVHWSSRYSIQPYSSIPFAWKDSNLLVCTQDLMGSFSCSDACKQLHCWDKHSVSNVLCVLAPNTSKSGGVALVALWVDGKNLSGRNFLQNLSGIFFVHWSSRYSIQPYSSIPFDWKDANLLLWSLLYSIRLDGFFLQLQHRLEAAADHSTSLCKGALLRQSTVCRMSYLSWPRPTHASLEA